MNLKNFLKAIQAIEDDRKISKEIVIDALKEALAKAYRKHVDIPDVLVRVDINEKSGDIKVYQQYTIVEEVEDEELEVSLEEAKEKDPNAELGGLVETQVSIEEFGRAAALLTKNVLKQRMREAEKQAVYDAYIDQLGEMVLGTVQTVEEKFVLVDLGKAIALMPRAAQMPNERYVEGQTLRVVITECNKETKGSQVLVSRGDADLVKRLFEREVPEIYDGIVQIKGIAREAGERTKMAVYSANPDVDPIGACIGPRGQRVQNIINELHGEKIDIFLWSENIVDLVKNSLAPANVLAVVPQEDNRTILVVVDENQLSLAIGKKGKNARLAVKLTGKKIDIKTMADLEEAGLDLDEMLLEYRVRAEQEAREKAAQKLREAEEAALLAAQETEEEEIEATDNITEEVAETVAEETVETVVEEAVEEVVAEKVQPVQEVQEEVVVEKPKKVKKELERRGEYVSKFEKLADASVKKEETSVRRKKKNNKEEVRKLTTKELLEGKNYDIRPVYTEEELEQIRLQEEAEQEAEWDIDYDEFEEYYEDEE